LDIWFSTSTTPLVANSWAVYAETLYANATSTYANLVNFINTNWSSYIPITTYVCIDGVGTYPTECYDWHLITIEQNTMYSGSIITSPRIINFTYSTTTATANITGYWEATTTPYVNQRLSFWQFSNALGKESYQQLTATTTGFFNFSFPFKDPYSFTATTSTTTAPIYNSFTLNASLDQYDETNYVFPYGGTVINNIDATSTIVSAVDNYNATDFILNPRSLALYPEYECGITSLTGCFKNALIWAFYPTQETLDNWSSLFTVIQTKAPVGYFYVAKNGISGLSATSTKAFNVVIPSSLKTYIFNPFDIGISGILWLFFVFNFYKRLKIITI
jgi:hypothetical protein